MALLAVLERTRSGDTEGAGIHGYYELTRLIERLHRRFLDVLRAGLVARGVSEVSPVQALLLVNVGREECSVRDLAERGYHLGSNAAYNIKKLIEGGYIEQRRAPHDRRSVFVRLTDTGVGLLAKVEEVQARLAETFAERAKEEAPDLAAALRMLGALERHWAERLLDRDI